MTTSTPYKDPARNEGNKEQFTGKQLDETKNQINDLEHKEEKTQSEQEEKRIQKNEDSVSSLGDNFKRTCIRNIRCQRRRERARNWNSTGKNCERKLPYFVEGNRHASLGSTESPKQHGCKEAHWKTYN